MFIYTVKANSLKFIAVILAAVAILVTVALLSESSEILTTDAIAAETKDINYDKIKTEEDRKKFLSQFGWEIEDKEIESVKVKLPGEFDKIMTEYNELQKSQGLDLFKYKGREVERYTYKISNYPDYSGTVYANIIIYRNRVIGGDICSSDISGFIHGFSHSNSNAE
ncbi:MAG: DUF4830 domain-containing protein [Ruminococcaceae bacterium]|nr:DUF4830 domain-containing protein [Oscillospiraceae bacterium]